jgi:hypothetical protein
VAVAAETGVQASTGEAEPASYEKTATFPGSDIELPPGTEVRVAGVPIGEVSEQDKSEAGVSVTMSIDPDYVPICDDATISIRGAGRGSLSELALAFKLIESAQHRWRAVNSAPSSRWSERARSSRTASSSNDPTNQQAATLTP